MSTIAKGEKLQYLATICDCFWGRNIPSESLGNRKIKSPLKKKKKKQT